MELGGISPAYSANPSAAARPPSSPDGAVPRPLSGGADTRRSPPGSDGRGPVRNLDTYECQTCKNRKYQDGSGDPGVSYKTPTKISPDAAAGAVRGHEQEHVAREQDKARREDREVVSQSVTLHTAICPACGAVYVSGGTTRTVTRAQQDAAARYGAAAAENDPSAGQTFSALA